MGNLPVSKNIIHGKTINALIIECLIIISFFMLFHSGVHGDSFHGLAPFLILLYAFGISICTGIVVASVAEKRLMTGWKLGMLASATTLILMFTMVCVPTMWSGLAFIIAPLVTIAVFFVFVNSHQATGEQ